MFRINLVQSVGLFVVMAVSLGNLTPPVVADQERDIDLGSGMRIQNVEDPFDYYINSWTVIGLKDYPDGTRITPNGELVLADGLLCRPLIGKPMVPLNRGVKKTLRKGYLPIVQSDFVLNETVEYTLEAFACPLGLSAKAAFDWPNFLNLFRVTISNVKEAPTEACFGLIWCRKDQELACEVQRTPSADTVSVFSNGALLGLLQLPEESRLNTEGPRLGITTVLDGKESITVTACMPYRPIRCFVKEALPILSQLDFEVSLGNAVTYWEDLLSRGTQVDVPEQKPMEVYKASLAYLFIGRDMGEVHPGEGFYDQVFLRDAAYQIISLAHAGYLDAARESVGQLWYHQTPHGQFLSQWDQYDANGYALWTFMEYYRLTHDIDFLRGIYGQMKAAVTWLQKERRQEKDPNSPFFGLLPGAFADGEALGDGKHHIVGYDFWNLRGIQSAVEAASVLGKDEDVQAFTKEFEAYRGDVFHALKRTGLSYIPPSYEKDGTHWGNLEVIFPSRLMDPHDPRVTATLDYVRNEFGAAKGNPGGLIEGCMQWSPPHSGAITPYMSQFVTNSHIIRGEGDKAIDMFYWFLLHTTSTHGFGEGTPYKQRRASGDVIPHLWAASMYVTTLRNMLLREQDQTLHLWSCVPVHWLDPGKQIRIENAPTHFGKAGFTAAAEEEYIRLKLDPPTRNAPRNIVIHLPEGIELESVVIQGKSIQPDNPREVSLESELAGKSCTLLMGIKRETRATPLTFESRVAAYEAEAANHRE